MSEKALMLIEDMMPVEARGTRPLEDLPPRRLRLWLKEGKKCHWCSRPTRMSRDNAKDMATIEHITPRYKGGTNDESNLVSACLECNARRNHEDMKGLPEGSLLHPSNVQMKQKLRVCLTGDEKKTLLAKVQAMPIHMDAIEVVREGRNQALKAVTALRAEVAAKQTEIIKLKADLAGMTIWKLIRRGLVEMLQMKE